ncbi:DUF3429 family protein [Oceanicella actignis]|uniref:DUF3429 domain-containing protein n=1 Tax=Oceanicella actignis TaxID=1189325 RepID=A0A1M7TV82_9RHOB|nr:DUF3429 family protein [Oceanicella actignis]SES79907.1 Protein of unknown function [Oceanicella actignis]SHN74637.1 Protein of unknown function [Oceanicella actignis]
MSPARAAALLGAAGLGPFWGFALAAHVAAASPAAGTALRAELAWGATILAFMAGARWAMALAAGAGAARLAAFALASLPAFGAPFMPTPAGLGLLAAAFVALLAVELAPASRAEAPPWYPALRIRLTSGVLAALGVAALAA